ncbi:MAG TPA: hypothetical protein VFR75_08970 [Solirubrobacterales bacterium]|nr:hypothetical protein [Solirubrobacterales bacterium]
MSAPDALRTLEMPYRWGEVDGMARVEMGIDGNPAEFGCEEIARGFPYLRASLEPAAVGYGDSLGWVQLVDLSDRRGSFRIDHWEALGRVSHPFFAFGPNITLFDHPHTTLLNWDFLAHTFLCGLGGELLEFRREVRALLGFSWAIVKRGERIEVSGPTPLGPEDWNGHLGHLNRRFRLRKWTFMPGFADGPLP